MSSTTIRIIKATHPDCILKGKNKNNYEICNPDRVIIFAVLDDRRGAGAELPIWDTEGNPGDCIVLEEGIIFGRPGFGSNPVAIGG
jgi:hypothetical protein